MSFVLRSGARPRLDAPDFNQHEPLELIGRAGTYESAYAQLEEQLPKDWVLLGIDRYLEDEGDEVGAEGAPERLA